MSVSSHKLSHLVSPRPLLPTSLHPTTPTPATPRSRSCGSPVCARAVLQALARWAKARAQRRSLAGWRDPNADAASALATPAVGALSASAISLAGLPRHASEAASKGRWSRTTTRRPAVLSVPHAQSHTHALALGHSRTQARLPYDCSPTSAAVPSLLRTASSLLLDSAASPGSAAAKCPWLTCRRSAPALP